MNRTLLLRFLNEKQIFKKETTNKKNFQCKCIICGDHSEPRKANHLYISTSKNMYNCFLNGCSGRTSNLLKTLGYSTEDINEVFSKEELSNQNYTVGIYQKPELARKFKELQIPKIDQTSFLNKRHYVKGRLNFLIEPENVPGLVFDIFKFFSDNEIKINHDIFNLDFLHHNYIGFVTENQTMMVLRSIIDNIPLKHFKLDLQEDPLEMRDYFLVQGNNKKSNTIIMAEGIFSLLGEYYTNSLNLKDDVRFYIATLGFDNSVSVLKSICYKYHIFDFDIIYLADRDKPIYKFKKFIDNSEHVISNLNIFYNLNNNDFGQFPIQPVKGGVLKDVKTYRKNKKTFSGNSFRRYSS